MSTDLEISRPRALLNRGVQFSKLRLGGPGALALVALAAAAAIALGARPLWHQQREDLLRQYVARLDLTVRLGAAASASAVTRDPRDQVRDSLPSIAERSKSVTLLLSMLTEGGLEALSGSYAVEDQAPDLIRLKVSVPVKGGYRPMRALVAKVLNDLPHAALDSLDLQLLADDSQIEGQLQLSLYFRKERP
jgi:hypothetical protein